MESWTLELGIIDACFWNNPEFLRRPNSETQLITLITNIKIAYMGHVLRGQKYHLLQLIMNGKIAGKRVVGQRQMIYQEHLRMEWDP